MDIIKYGNLYKKEKKVKAKCPHCGTKVAMIKEDYQLCDYQTNMIWNCPFCQKNVTTKRFNPYRTWDEIIKWFEYYHEIVIVILLSILMVGAMVVLPIIYVVVNSNQDNTDNYLIDYHYKGVHYKEYVDNYKLEGNTLYIWDDGEKTQYNEVKFNKVTTLKEEK
jgi:endogenous inhibitor of DNA gyrase (YacG/DUF329 family)